MNILEQTSLHIVLFFILYGITGAVSLIAAVYLLLRRGNAFAPDVTPPLRLRRWAASFFAVSALGHVWWMFFYIYSRDIHSAAYVAVVVLDCVTLLTTVAGTLLAMLQDRRRPVWPAPAAMLPFVALGLLHICYPDGPFVSIAAIYILALYVLFSVYMAFAVRRYGRWLNDNYADLENKKVWLTQVVSLDCLLLFLLYCLVDNDSILIYILHVVAMVLYVLLLWRVETLSQLAIASKSQDDREPDSEADQESDQQSQKSVAIPSNIGQLLTEHCVDSQLYLQHDLSLAQLSAAVGINRFYLSQYFSSQGMNYNTYINALRIQHFVTLYRQTVAARRSVTAQQLAQQSGFRSYSTFSSAFKQRMGQSVTVWMRDMTE